MPSAKSAAELSDDVLAAALAAAQARAASLERQLGNLIADRDAVKKEIELLGQLLHVRRGVSEGDSSRRKATSWSADATPRGPNPAVTAAIAELEAAGRPLHISELMQALQDKGVRIPGSGRQANLIAHLTRNPQVVRPSRGMYGLAAWGLSEKPRLKKANRRRVRGTSKSASSRES
jgi:hypothetical protein